MHTVQRGAWLPALQLLISQRSDGCSITVILAPGWGELTVGEAKYLATTLWKLD